MVALLALAFLLIPIGELYVIIKVSGAIGFFDTLGILVVVSIVGAWLVRREGLGIIRRVNQRLAQGSVPGKELVDGLLIVVAGAFMLTPGFITDSVGLALLLPPVRAMVRGALAKKFHVRTIEGLGGYASNFRGFGTSASGGRIYDSTGTENPSNPDPPVDPRRLEP